MNRELTYIYVYICVSKLSIHTKTIALIYNRHIKHTIKKKQNKQ